MAAELDGLALDAQRRGAPVALGRRLAEAADLTADVDGRAGRLVRAAQTALLGGELRWAAELLGAAQDVSPARTERLDARRVDLRLAVAAGELEGARVQAEAVDATFGADDPVAVAELLGEVARRVARPAPRGGAGGGRRLPCRDGGALPGLLQPGSGGPAPPRRARGRCATPLRHWCVGIAAVGRSVINYQLDLRECVSAGREALHLSTETGQPGLTPAVLSTLVLAAASVGDEPLVHEVAGRLLDGDLQQVGPPGPGWPGGISCMADPRLPPRSSPLHRGVSRAARRNDRSGRALMTGVGRLVPQELDGDSA